MRENYIIIDGDNVSKRKSVDNNFIAGYHGDCIRCKYRELCKIYGHIGIKCKYYDKCFNYSRCRSKDDCVADKYKYEPIISINDIDDKYKIKMSDFENVLGRLKNLAIKFVDNEYISKWQHPDYFNGRLITLHNPPNANDIAKLIYAPICTIYTVTDSGASATTIFDGFTPSIFQVTGYGLNKHHDYQYPDENGNPVLYERYFGQYTYLAYTNLKEGLSLPIVGDYQAVKGTIFSNMKINVSFCENCGKVYSDVVDVCPYCLHQTILMSLYEYGIEYANGFTLKRYSPIFNNLSSLENEDYLFDREQNRYFVGYNNLFNCSGYNPKRRGRKVGKILRVKDKKIKDYMKGDLKTSDAFKIVSFTDGQLEDINEGSDWIITKQDLPVRRVNVYEMAVDENGDPYAKQYPLYRDNHNIFLGADTIADNQSDFEDNIEDNRNNYINLDDFCVIKIRFMNGGGDQEEKWCIRMIDDIRTYGISPPEGNFLNKIGGQYRNYYNKGFSVYFYPEIDLNDYDIDYITGITAYYFHGDINNIKGYVIKNNQLEEDNIDIFNKFYNSFEECIKATFTKKSDRCYILEMPAFTIKKPISVNDVNILNEMIDKIYEEYDVALGLRQWDVNVLKINNNGSKSYYFRNGYHGEDGYSYNHGAYYPGGISDGTTLYGADCCTGDNANFIEDDAWRDGVGEEGYKSYREFYSGKLIKVSNDPVINKISVNKARLYCWGYVDSYYKLMSRYRECEWNNDIVITYCGGGEVFNVNGYDNCGCVTKHDNYTKARIYVYKADAELDEDGNLISWTADLENPVFSLDNLPQYIEVPIENWNGFYFVTIVGSLVDNDISFNYKIKENYYPDGQWSEGLHGEIFVHQLCLKIDET